MTPFVGWPRPHVGGGASVRPYRATVGVLMRCVEPPRPRARVERRGNGSAQQVVERRASGVFVDYNQNAKDRTVASAYSVRPTPDARVSAPLLWNEGGTSRTRRLRSGRCRSASPRSATARRMDASADRSTDCSSSQRARNRKGRGMPPGRRTTASKRGSRRACRPSQVWVRQRIPAAREQKDEKLAAGSTPRREVSGAGRCAGRSDARPILGVYRIASTCMHVPEKSSGPRAPEHLLQLVSGCDFELVVAALLGLFVGPPAQNTGGWRNR